MKRVRSLQGRVLALVTGMVAAVWAAAAVFTWLDARHELDELLDAHLAQAAALLVAQQAQELEEQEDVQALVLHRYASRVVFQVFHEGRLSLKSANAPAAPLIASANPIEGFSSVQVGGTPWRVFAARGAEADVQVFVGEAAASRTSILQAVLRGTLWPMLVALPLLALATWWAVARGLAPLRRTSDEIARRKPQDLRPIALEGVPAELAPMLQALDQLFARIDRLLTAERRFTADAAHELRTPIAGIRAQAQVAQAETDEALRQHALQGLLQGCDRAARLVDQLLTLARVESDTGIAFEPVALGELVRQVVAEQAPRALQKQQDLACEADAEGSVSGVPLLLSLLVRNLVDNAIRYSPEGARIDVRVGREAAAMVLDVHDSGPGMSDQHLARLGERFFRVPGQDATGSGLGWSIVQQIAALHGADVSVRPSPLGGLDVRVALPA